MSKPSLLSCVKSLLGGGLTLTMLTANASQWIPISVNGITIFIPGQVEAVADSITINEDVTTEIDVLSNDVNLSGTDNTLYVSKIFSGTKATKGTVTKITNAQGVEVASYQPPLNYFGKDYFTYSVTNSYGSSSTTEVEITINSVNDAPAFPSNISLYYRTFKPEDINNLVIELPTMDESTDVDNNMSELTVKIRIDYAENWDYVGNYSLKDGNGNTKPGVVFFMPTSEKIFNTNAHLSYSVTDPSGATVNHFINLMEDSSVSYVPTSPDVADTYENQSVTIDVTSNDSKQSVPVEIHSSPANGTVSVNSANNSIVYTPNNGFIGIESFAYKLNNSTYVSSETVVTVNVLPVTNTPIVNRFEWVPAVVQTGENTTFYWDISNVEHCRSVSIGSNTEAVRAPAGHVGPYVYNTEEVHETKWYCVDLNGNRFPADENEFITATRTVVKTMPDKKILDIHTDLLGTP
ncbi:hypothetical protein tinsulaeT_20930 [Thalassotalea insulae]|uniref:Tandem-95 repeat protein n=1 Tax=Thalassotalea insulae TaxID=2056778 RepID=A0ABQ6GS27_9GAMM|nr:Ig-like domain-containing protein [Thalassotalea insulae]GLX78753.1 hypothetical protein tinsulaeT_20930 [Thalassotalea insulae]